MDSLKEMEEPGSESNESDNDCNLDHLEAQNNATTSSFAALYKARTQLTQEKRREELLQSIKLRRSQTVDEKRGLLELFNEQEASVEDLEIGDEEPEPMEVEVRWRRRRKKKKVFRNKLMMSEWLTEIPRDLEYQWLVKSCPVGVRNLVVAREKITKAYDKKGYCLATFQSDLPGGGVKTLSYARFTVLDCIFNRQTQCYYVLDILAWNNYSLKPCNSDFRFYWLKSKFAEAPGLKEKSVHNKYCFYEVEAFPAELPLIQDKLSRPYVENDEALELDGLLFYHREADYTEGSTPLVGWLKPYMVPEMLHLPVEESFVGSIPDNYTSMQEYVNSNKHRNRRRSRKAPVDNTSVMME